VGFANIIFARKILFSTLSRIKKTYYSFRTKLGLKNAQQRGVKLGRPAGLSDEAKMKADSLIKLYLEKSLTVDELCKQENVAKATLYRYLKADGISLYKDSK